MSSLTISITETDLRAPEFFQRHGFAADLRRARRTVFEKIERPLGQRGEIGGRVTQHILGHHAAVKLCDKRGRHVGAARAKFGASLCDQSAGGVFVLAGGKFIGHGAGRRLRESVEHGGESSRSRAGRREQPTIW